MAALSRLGDEVTRFLLALLRGCAQLAFCDTAPAGVLVLAGIALIAPFNALGTLLGAVFGTLVGRFSSAYLREEWASGLASFNPAIVGLLWGGFLASGEVHIVFLLPLLALSVLLDVVFRKLLGRVKLPALSVGAFATVYLVSLAAAPPGCWFWTEAPSPGFVPLGLMGAACILGATIMQSGFAALWASLLGTVTLLTGWMTNHDPAGFVGLWALTVPLASFGVHAVFLRGALAGCIAGAVAASLGAAIWIAWEATSLGGWFPPLLMPFILGVWLAIILMRRLSTSPVTQPAFWRMARLLAEARAQDRQVVALMRDTGVAGSPASSFIDGAWLDSQRARDAFAAEQLRASSRCRQAFWEACERLRAEANRRQAGGFVPSIAKLRTRGWVRTVAIQDIPGPAETARLDGLVSLHGDVDRTLCLDCGMLSDWPPVPVWRRCDLRCRRCQGPMVPNVTPFGRALDEPVLNRLNDLAGRCAVVLVLGEEACEPATASFLEHVRRNGARVVFVSRSTTNYPRRAADLSVRVAMQPCIELLYMVLQGWRIAVWARNGHSVGRLTRIVRRARKGVAG